MEKSLNKILSDKKSGSTELYLKLLKWCKANSRNINKLHQMVLPVSEKLKSFSAIQNFIKELQNILRKNDSEFLKNFLDEKINSIINNSNIIFENALPYLKNHKRIVTISNSKTIFEILIKLNEHHKINVVVSESRPQLEGRILAKKLIMNKIKVEIVTEAQLTKAVEESDAVIVGADMILSNGDVINKTGSRGLAVLAKYFNKPFYVLTSEEKRSKKNSFTQDGKDENEIWSFNHSLLKKKNNYFEVIEKKLITKVITEKTKS